VPELLAAALIRDIPDFPKVGIMFKDITPVLSSYDALMEVIGRLTESARDLKPDIVVGIESRGFLLGVPVALNLGVGFVPDPKLGKLPYKTISEEYALEYGTNTVEIHSDAISPGQRVLVIDDLLATGGTAAAAARLIEKIGGHVVGFQFLVELAFLPGRIPLAKYNVESLIRYE
jgi:adenine phosphoribosyltransferase